MKFDRYFLHISTGQDGTLQSFSTIHEKFNKSLGHGRSFARRKKKLLVTKETFQDTVRQPVEVSLINFLFFLDKIKKPLYGRVIDF